VHHDTANTGTVTHITYVGTLATPGLLSATGDCVLEQLGVIPLTRVEERRAGRAVSVCSLNERDGKISSGATW